MRAAISLLVLFACGAPQARPRPDDVIVASAPDASIPEGTASDAGVASPARATSASAPLRALTEVECAKLSDNYTRFEIAEKRIVDPQEQALLAQLRKSDPSILLFCTTPVLSEAQVRCLLDAEKTTAIDACVTDVLGPPR